jgi:hypothetical protein
MLRHGYLIPFRPRLHKSFIEKKKLIKLIMPKTNIDVYLYKIFCHTKLHLPLELWTLISRVNQSHVKKLAMNLSNTLKFPTCTAFSPFFHEYQIFPGVIRFDFGFHHGWDILYDAYGNLIHKVHTYGLVINIAGRVFPRSRACLYGDYGNGCTWIFEHEGFVTTLTYDLEYGYRSLIAW